MEWRQTNPTANHLAEALEAVELVLTWPDLSDAIKTKWCRVYLRLCGGRPREIEVTMAQLAAAFGKSKTDARNFVEDLRERDDGTGPGLIRVKYAPEDKRSRRQGAQKWKLQFPHPADVASGQFRRFVESKETLQLQFGFAVDDLSVDGAAAPEGTGEAGDEAPATLSFTHGQDAPPVEPTNGVATTPPSASADARCSRPAAAASPPPPVAKLDLTLRQVASSPPSCRKVGPNSATGASSDFRDRKSIPASKLQTTNQPTSEASCSGGTGRPGFKTAAPRSAVASLGDALAQSIERLGRRHQMTEHVRVEELVRWRARILDLLDHDPRLDDDFVENFAEAIVDGLPALGVRKFFRRMDWKKKNPSGIRTEFIWLFIDAAKRFARDCGVPWGHAKPR